MSVPRHVFTEETRRPHALNDGEYLIKEPSVIVLSALLSSDGIWLARVAASDAIHKSAPWFMIEGGKVRPNRRRVKASILHTRRQPCGRRDFPLQVANCASIGTGDSDAEFETSDAGADGDDVVGTCSHTYQTLWLVANGMSSSRSYGLFPE